MLQFYSWAGLGVFFVVGGAFFWGFCEDILKELFQYIKKVSSHFGMNTQSNYIFVLHEINQTVP